MCSRGKFQILYPIPIRRFACLIRLAVLPTKLTSSLYVCEQCLSSESFHDRFLRVREELAEFRKPRFHHGFQAGLNLVEVSNLRCAVSTGLDILR